MFTSALFTAFIASVQRVRLGPGRTVWLFAMLLASCVGPSEDEPEQPKLGSITQGIDSDSDGMDDAWETTHFGNLSQAAAGDFDSDGMTNLEEFQNSFNPTLNDAYQDADGDRYPNVFEVRAGSDPNNSGSLPTPTYTVNGAGGGTHTTVGAAVTAATVANGAYQIIAVAAGTYKGANNVALTIASTKPNLLILGLDGAEKTVIDGDVTNSGWTINNSSVIASLTFRKTTRALNVDAAGKALRFVDLLVRDNATVGNLYATGLQVGAAASVQVVGSTFLNNTSPSAAAHQIFFTANATMVNTVVIGAAGTLVAKHSSVTLTTNYCLVKGQTLTGTGNLAGSTDPKLRTDGHLLWDSPLRAAGGTVAQSRIDIDGEVRPSSTPDIGIDQFIDSDADQLADKWELDEAGNLTTLTSLAQDADSDGLTNEQEYLALVKPTVADTDGDGLSDGVEVNTHGTNPLSTDTDSDGMPDAWEVTYGLTPTVANAYDDADGDRYPNIFEYVNSTNPSSASSTPTPTYTVNGAGGGTHTTIGAAITAANVANGAHQIIAIAPGVYKGAGNINLTIASTKPNLLILGLDGADKTVIDGDGTNAGWTIQNSSVIESMTFRKTTRTFVIDTAGKAVRLIDLLVRDNNLTGSSQAAGVHVVNEGKLHIIGSSFINNTSVWNGAQQIYVPSGALTVTNTLVTGGVGNLLGAGGAVSVAITHSLVSGQTIAGTGNLAAATNPKVRSDGHLLWDSPLRAAGTTGQSRTDMDGELRPTNADIGADQFYDSDSDQVADEWELKEAGNLTTLTSRTQDADGDGLTNEQEHALLLKPTVADTDGDGLSDGSEVNTHGTNPLATDTDGDDMPDAWEVAHGLSPTVANGFDDADGDRYPNVFEYAGSSDPSDRLSVPASTYTVNPAGGGTHTTIGAAVTSANVVNGAYQIIGIAPGTYTGNANLRGVTIAATKPKLLMIGLNGAANTVIDGQSANWGWLFNQSTVVASLTFKNSYTALAVDAPGKEVRFVDLLVRDNILIPSGYFIPAGVYVANAAKVDLIGSTLIDNSGYPTGHQVGSGSANARLINTAVTGPYNTLLTIGTGTLTASHSFVRGQTLTGTGNLPGLLDPCLRADARLRSDSPLRGAAGTVAQSRIDMDGELRPSSAADIGVDQFLDSDSDGLPDSWELANAGSLGATTGSADPDNDDLSNLAEYDLETDWQDADSDNDGIPDGLEDRDFDLIPDAEEIALGMDPFVADSDDLTSDLDQDGLLDSISVQVGHSLNNLDSDGDGISNADEALMCTNPLRADTDGDGVPDNTDAFPLDPLISSMPSNPLDTTPPVITLTAPWYAVEL